MTVRELINELEKFSHDEIVYIEYDMMVIESTTLKYRTVYPHGDSFNTYPHDLKNLNPTKKLLLNYGYLGEEE